MSVDIYSLPCSAIICTHTAHTEVNAELLELEL